MPKNSIFSRLCSLFPLTLACVCVSATASSVTVSFDTNSAPLVFAAEEIRAASALAKDLPKLAVSLNVDTAAVLSQGYRIKLVGDNLTVTGGDAVGTMYGGLDVAEAIHTDALDSLKDSTHTPHIAQRGIKFNIPLDLRTPTYSDPDPSDAAEANIPEMWSMDFWRVFLDDLARRRYNVLSLWSLHPFPSIVKVPEFPHVALDDVWRTTVKFDTNFYNSGRGVVRAELLAHHEVVKKLTIAEKSRFWRDVMQLAKDRGVDVYWFTWNAFLDGAEGKDGIANDAGSPRAIEYLRDSVRETVKTYPLLAGFGITAGENMRVDMGGMTKEQWLWKTYGEGIRDALKEQPQRKLRLIHRFHQTGLSDIQSAFKELPCPLDLSFKYAIAHMYSVPDPIMIKPVLPLLSPQLRSWLTVRNDDIYSFRWADLDYARAFVKAIPGEDKIAGFYMGPDGYIWGRDFLTKDAATPRQTVMQKQWLSFALWGRLAYDPDLSVETFQRLIAARFPGADVPALTAAWAGASKTFPYITRFFWGDIDAAWFPEACRHRSGFYTVRHFIEGGTMPGAGVLNIMEWRASYLTEKKFSGITPIEIAATLEANASNALRTLPQLQRAVVKPASSAREHAATLGDIEAMSELGLYYAEKIRGACDLALFDKTGEVRQQTSSVEHLESALGHWGNYAAAYTRQYVQPVFYDRVGLVDIPKQTANVAADVQMARDWKSGTINEAKIKRAGTEAGFRK
jgi:hypothetical protein